MTRIFAHSALLFLSLAFSAHSWAAAATVTHMSGTLSVLKPDGTAKLLSQNSVVEQGDILTTEKDSYARIKFSDGGEVTLRPNSRIKLDAYAYDEEKPEQDSFVFSLVKGGLRTITGLVGKRGNRDAYRLNTATATIGIRGTAFGLLFCQGNCGKLADGLYLDVTSGAIHAANAGGGQDFGAGMFGFVEKFDIKPILLPQDPGLPKFDPNKPSPGGDENGGGGCYVM